MRAKRSFEIGCGVKLEIIRKARIRIYLRERYVESREEDLFKGNTANHKIDLEEKWYEVEEAILTTVERGISRRK